MEKDKDKVDRLDIIAKFASIITPLIMVFVTMGMTVETGKQTEEYRKILANEEKVLAQLNGVTDKQTKFISEQSRYLSKLAVLQEEQLDEFREEREEKKLEAMPSCEIYASSIFVPADMQFDSPKLGLDPFIKNPNANYRLIICLDIANMSSKPITIEDFGILPDGFESEINFIIRPISKSEEPFYCFLGDTHFFEIAATINLPIVIGAYKSLSCEFLLECEDKITVNNGKIVIYTNKGTFYENMTISLYPGPSHIMHTQKTLFDYLETKNMYKRLKKIDENRAFILP